MSVKGEHWLSYQIASGNFVGVYLNYAKAKQIVRDLPNLEIIKVEINSVNPHAQEK